MSFVNAHTHVAYSAMPLPLQLEGWLLAHYLVWLQKSWKSSVHQWPRDSLRRRLGREGDSLRKGQNRLDHLKIVISRVNREGNFVSNRSTTPPKERLLGNVVFEIGNSGIILTSISSVDIAETTRSNITLIRIRQPASV